MDNKILGAVAIGAGIFASIATLRGVINLLKDDLEIEYVSSEEHCKRAIRRILKETSKYPVLGLDCEWEPEHGTTNNVHVISLATSGEYCAVIQIAKFKNIPDVLKDLLRNQQIFKVGVGIQIDQQHLGASGLILNHWVDLRHLNDSINYPSKASSSSSSLEGLSKKILGKDLDKREQLSGKWDQKLTKGQIDYAAKDANAGICICNALVEYAFQGSQDRALQLLLEYSESPYPRRQYPSVYPQM